MLFFQSHIVANDKRTPVAQQSYITTAEVGMNLWHKHSMSPKVKKSKVTCDIICS